MRAPSKFLLFLGLAQICLISALLLHARSIQDEKVVPMADLSGPDQFAERLTQIQIENSRLKKDLSEIAALRAEVQLLENQITQESIVAADSWAAQSNHIQSAIEQTRRKVAELEEWELQFRLSGMQKQAADRLVQKGPIDYALLDANLRLFAKAMNKHVTLTRDWENSQKTTEQRANYSIRQEEAWGELEKARKQLGDDMALFEELSAPPTGDFSKTPFLRSVLPDQRGFTATLYLDGRVVWTPPLK